MTHFNKVTYCMRGLWVVQQINSSKLVSLCQHNNTCSELTSQAGCVHCAYVYIDTFGEFGHFPIVLSAKHVYISLVI